MGAPKRLVKIGSKFQLKYGDERCCGDDDRLSALPDDILIVILSFLPLKDSARTSVLSPRWMNLWLHTPSLDFEADKALDKLALLSRSPDLSIRQRRKLYRTSRRKYMRLVNRILKLHEAPILKKFGIFFDLNKKSWRTITQWLEFAIARKVERLELELLEDGEEEFCSTATENSYSLPGELLVARSFEPLTSLSLKNVNVTGEAIEFFLRSCPHLERLVVHFTNMLSSLKVSGSSLVLKHLEVCNCLKMKTINVSAPKLVSLRITEVGALSLQNVPMLVELSLMSYREFGLHATSFLAALSCCASQLEMLELGVVEPKGAVEHFKFPEMPKLKKLVVEFSSENDSLMELTSLIRASPYVQEFVLKLPHYKTLSSDGGIKNDMRCPLSHLKFVKFCGFYGRPCDELVTYILANCDVLEKITVDPRTYDSRISTSEELIQEQTARDYAKQHLEGKVHQHIELVIL